MTKRHICCGQRPQESYLPPNAWVVGKYYRPLSNWTLCSPLSQFCSEVFPTFDFHTGEGQFLITPGKLDSLNLSETQGFQCLGHSNWTICSPLSQFCSENFPIFSLSYWGANSYYPRGLIMGKGKFLQLPIWIRLRGFSAWAIQTGPLAAL